MTEVILVAFAIGLVVVIRAVWPNGSTLNLDTKDFPTEKAAQDYAEQANKGMNK